MALLPPFLYSQSIFINEIHYDNDGTDTGEAIEIAAPAGTDLSQWTLELYNGANGTRYNTLNLTSVTPDLDGGYGVEYIMLPSNGLQNGSPDGIALIDNLGNVVQFLSYEGSFTAVDGTAMGATSEDIGVEESNSSPINGSLQLLGAGTDYTNFTWEVTVQNTFGSINADQFFSEPVNNPLINEFVFNHTGSDTDEFVEIYGLPNTDLSSYWILEIEGDNTSAGTIDGVLQLGTTNENGFYTTPFAGNEFENGSVTLLLVENFTGNLGDVIDTDADGTIDVVSWNTITDAIAVNDGGSGDLLYAETVLNPDFDGGSFAVGGASRIPNGVHTNSTVDWVRNSFNGAGLPSFPDAEASPGEALNTPATSNQVFSGGTDAVVIINEIDADTPGTDTAEFIELFDGGTGNTPLDGLVVVLYNGNGDTVYNTFDLDGQTTNANGYFVLGNEGVPNVSMVFSGNGLQNGADAVAIYQGSAADFPNGSNLSLDGLIDAIVYDTDDEDDTELLALLNAGQPQLNENEQGDKGTHSLQRIPNGAGGMRNTSSYLAQTPTPGAENGGIVEPTEPVTIAEARNLPDGTTVTISGVLTVAHNFAGPAYMQDQTGGIAIFDEQVHGGNFAIGDSITITATRSSFNNQIQVGPVSVVTNNGLPTNPITPKNITLAELPDHRGELVRVTNVSFPSPGNLFFGNSNFQVTDASGTGELRIDADVETLAGTVQPETCNEIIGVVGTFEDIAQLLPRFDQDLPCAEPFDPDNGIDLPKDQTIDIVTWNIEWFGDEGNSPAAGNPNSDAIQRDSVVTIMKQLDADIYTVVEISDDALFAQAVNELDGYDFVLSEATSYPNDTGTKQKVGFVYKTATVTPKKTQALLATLHPYYNGGDTSYLTDYPAEADRFYASGRLPFLMTADVSINGATEEVNIIALHARANSSDGAQLRYDMRTYDIEVLKDSLDVMFPDNNIVLAGDYNDDLDETVADGINTTISSYNSFINDPDNYYLATLSLSEKGFRSYAFRENMIDHISLSNELEDNYIDNSAIVHYEFYDGDYTNTVSDHFPVSIRLELGETIPLAIEELTTTNATCYGAANATASLALSGGVLPYKYLWSNGATTQTIKNLAPGEYSITVTDAVENTVTANFTIAQPEEIIITMPQPETLYIGYGASECATLTPENISGGTGAYSYQWNTGETTQSITVCPEQTTTYTLTVTDENNCTKTTDITIEVENVSCGNNPWIEKVAVCFKGKSLCVSKYAVPHLLQRGAVLGSCKDQNNTSVASICLAPNPVWYYTALIIRMQNRASLDIALFDISGQLRYQKKNVSVKVGYNIKPLQLASLPQGIYILKVYENGRAVKDLRVVKK
ncbi:DUF5689 domain-containing protein [Galbibacter pacificus]|uniref:DUF5689 domain-containing protein n=1 Tax=Galbibacter pacificus TaxID=2996052 RepID=A0ABT6FTE0_9FLAO|nr:DUF5689 domain-containing protein [Galbibacter pacificus]MDG3583039.1 DUF5689 domain-containing protein [Galbibacter pacificus]MDG3586520.1 DUF5689 domain-containing protein [Galbibacter pacificus]